MQDALLHELDEFMEESEQFDDITMMFVKRIDASKSPHSGSLAAQFTRSQLLQYIPSLSFCHSTDYFIIAIGFSLKSFVFAMYNRLVSLGIAACRWKIM